MGKLGHIGSAGGSGFVRGGVVKEGRLKRLTQAQHGHCSFRLLLCLSLAYFLHLYISQGHFRTKGPSMVRELFLSSLSSDPLSQLVSPVITIIYCYQVIEPIIITIIIGPSLSVSLDLSGHRACAWKTSLFLCRYKLSCSLI